MPNRLPPLLARARSCVEGSIQQVSIAVIVVAILAILGAMTQPTSWANHSAVGAAVSSHRATPRASTTTSSSTTSSSATSAPATATAAAPPTTTTPPPAPIEAAPAPATTEPNLAAAAIPPASKTEHLSLPTGKGMWLWQFGAAEGGDANAIVGKAKAVGLTHLYVRTGSTQDGFYAAPDLDALLPVAHANGLTVIGWDFPEWTNVADDVQRAFAAIFYTTPTGDRIDGFTADMETPSEGTNLTVENAMDYGHALRTALGASYPLIATVPRPSPAKQGQVPYNIVTAWFDAIAPMDYWLDDDPTADTTAALEYLAQFNKPVIPVGQAYDAALEGGHPGPDPAEITAFMTAAKAGGASGVSFWSWQHTSDATWQAIADGPANN